MKDSSLRRGSPDMWGGQRLWQEAQRIDAIIHYRGGSIYYKGKKIKRTFYVPTEIVIALDGARESYMGEKMISMRSSALIVFNHLISANLSDAFIEYIKCHTNEIRGGTLGGDSVKRILAVT